MTKNLNILSSGAHTLISTNITGYYGARQTKLKDPTINSSRLFLALLGCKTKFTSSLYK